MNVSRLMIAAATALLACAPAFAQTAQNYPSKPVRVILPYPPGGSSDPLVRAMAQRLSDAFKVNFVVDNRPGANGIIGTEILVKSPPDGYTIALGSTSTMPMNAAIYAKLPYDPLKDFSFISSFSFTPLILVVHPSVPVKSIKELIAFAKARPDELLFSSSGVGGPQHLTLELFNSMAGTRILHVPYKGTAPSMLDLVGGRVSVSSASLTSATPLEKTGKLRMLAVVGARRSAARPDLPTVAEAGVPGFSNDIWYGAFAPAGTPRDVVAKLSAESVRILQQKDVREKLLALGLESSPMTSEEFTAFFRAEVAKIAKIAASAGIKPE